MEVYLECARTLAHLHTIDVSTISSPKSRLSYGKRQTQRWKQQVRTAFSHFHTRQFDASKTTDIPEFDQLYSFLSSNSTEDLDKDEMSVICHGDFRLGNIIFHPTQNRILAVLDWELWTSGHPVLSLERILLTCLVRRFELLLYVISYAFKQSCSSWILRFESGPFGYHAGEVFFE
jgi:aminoglycoside phosphotransferase (APT) family kinase protein